MIYCTIAEAPGCGEGALGETFTIKPTFFTHGCLTLVQVFLKGGGGGGASFLKSRYFYLSRRNCIGR